MKKRFIIITFLISFVLIAGSDWYIDASRKGTDDKVVEAIQKNTEKYKPWTNIQFGINSELGQNMLFGVQGAAGVTFIAYYVRKKKNDKNDSSSVENQQA